MQIFSHWNGYRKSGKSVDGRENETIILHICTRYSWENFWLFIDLRITPGTLAIFRKQRICTAVKKIYEISSTFFQNIFSIFSRQIFITSVIPLRRWSARKPGRKKFEKARNSCESYWSNKAIIYIMQYHVTVGDIWKSNEKQIRRLRSKII